MLVEMTNLEGQRVFAEEWCNIDWTEILAFIGLLKLHVVYGIVRWGGQFFKPPCHRPELNIPVDEYLVGFRGRCPFKQYIPSKPAKYGIKIWAACDAKTSYCFNMQVYTGKPAGAQHEKNLSKE